MHCGVETRSTCSTVSPLRAEARRESSPASEPPATANEDRPRLCRLQLLRRQAVLVELDRAWGHRSRNAGRERLHAVVRRRQVLLVSGRRRTRQGGHHPLRPALHNLQGERTLPHPPDAHGHADRDVRDQAREVAPGSTGPSCRNRPSRTAGEATVFESPVLPCRVSPRVREPRSTDRSASFQHRKLRPSPLVGTVLCSAIDLS
jgi:hypothetical protein